MATRVNKSFCLVGCKKVVTRLSEQGDVIETPPVTGASKLLRPPLYRMSTLFTYDCKVINRLRGTVGCARATKTGRLRLVVRSFRRPEKRCLRPVQPRVGVDGWVQENGSRAMLPLLTANAAFTAKAAA